MAVKGALWQEAEAREKVGAVISLRLPLAVLLVAVTCAGVCKHCRYTRWPYCFGGTQSTHNAYAAWSKATHNIPVKPSPQCQCL